MLLLSLWGCPDPEYIDPPRRGPGGSVESPSDSERYHPEGYDDPTAHGEDAKQQAEACVDCHGESLEGQGQALSCDTCHPAGWRTDCTFCHGGTDNQTGAPPVDISGLDEGDDSRFAPHSAHVQDTELHAAFDCTECHLKPEGPLTAGHLFVEDLTPGKAEVDFSGGLSSAGSWNGGGLCSNLYCHGDGQERLGEKGHVGSLDTCGQSCHRSADFEGLPELGGRHTLHIEDRIGCADCHESVIDQDNVIIDVSLHVNGVLDVQLEHDLGWDGSTCSGQCHGHDHASETWAD